ncbi:polysaccharide deacetylase family protein [Gelidibacter mesophilus]|uniref:polysaccharide deacetylase family protein n=1 Tax=Gelidibacter mesophilus TaxID=169050 RepID=UPI0004226D57|nr:polysaccharide deacetylase family protein [Gelidibacter mesophilus]
MNLIPVKTPKLIKGIFPSYTWDMPQDQKVIYLTFDDGPTPEITNWTLDLLRSYNAKATFFCIGNNIEKYPDIFNDLIKDGHAIGNHTYHHPKGWTTNSDVYVNQVIKTQDLIALGIQNTKLQITNHKSTIANLFRPPYGQITPKQGKRLLALGYKIIMWDILAFDWKNSISPEECEKNVILKAGNGSIIVFHDSVKAAPRMKFALTKTLEHFSRKGYQFKCIE